MRSGPVAVTGPGGRLGRAVVAALEAAGTDVRSWGRPSYDLDNVDAGAALVARDAPALVIHCAAWTDVDGCAREPELAERRNATAVGELASACARVGADLVIVSTNEVFDGRRTDRVAYREEDSPAPINAYGASKLHGEDLARAAFAHGTRSPWIVRTSWLYGPPGNDFPAKIVAAADRLGPEQHLRVVADEWASPTSATDLADAIVALVSVARPGIYHLTSGGWTSRAGWARHVLRLLRPAIEVEEITQREFPRASTPPSWGVLDTSKAAAAGVVLRSWQDALDAQLGLNAPR